MRRGATLVILLAAACTREPATTSTATPTGAATAVPTVTAETTATAPAATTATVMATATANGPAPKQGCATKGYRAPAGARPTLSVASRGTLLDVTWGNAGTAPVCLYAFVATHEEHFDWLSVELAGVGATRTLAFVDDRDKSAPVSVELAPGERFTKTVDLTVWALRRTNGSKALAPGTYSASVTFDSTRETWAWSGKLTSATSIVVR